ncbi:MAG TPA: hypothetical protein VII93_01895 [Anaerolineales bacterium]
MSPPIGGGPAPQARCIGIPEYMAPEQDLGGMVNQGADIQVLGGKLTRLK